MSKGNPIVPVRFDSAMLFQMRDAIAQRNERTSNEPWTMSDFIKAAVWEKLCHMERSRKGKRRKRKEDSADQ